MFLDIFSEKYDRKGVPLFTRRKMLLHLLLAGGTMTVASSAWGKPEKKFQGHRGPVIDPLCTVYRSVNGSPQENLRKIIEMIGGVETLFGEDDVVLIKPGGDWALHREVLKGQILVCRDREAYASFFSLVDRLGRDEEARIARAWALKRELASQGPA